MDYTIIDAHAHLWLRQDTEVNGQKIQTLDNGKSLFMGEISSDVAPFYDRWSEHGGNFLSNMNYAQVSASVITQEYIDGDQNEYLREVQQNIPTVFSVVVWLMFARKGIWNMHEYSLKKGSEESNFRRIVFHYLKDEYP